MVRQPQHRTSEFGKLTNDLKFALRRAKSWIDRQPLTITWFQANEETANPLAADQQQRLSGFCGAVADEIAKERGCDIDRVCVVLCILDSPDGIAVAKAFVRALGTVVRRLSRGAAKTLLRDPAVLDAAQVNRIPTREGEPDLGEKFRRAEPCLTVKQWHVMRLWLGEGAHSERLIALTVYGEGRQEKDVPEAELRRLVNRVKRAKQRIREVLRAALPEP